MPDENLVFLYIFGTIKPLIARSFGKMTIDVSAIDFKLEYSCQHVRHSRDSR